MNKPSSFVIEIDPKLAAKMKEDLKRQGFQLSQPNYTLFQAKKTGITCTLYASGKLMVQGKNKDDFIIYYLEPEILGNLSYSYPKNDIDMTPRIGVDEAGKGDVFGPLCIASLYANEAQIETLVKLGIRDSKRLGDPAILKIADKIKKDFECSVVQIFPEKYNVLYEQFQNLNRLLAWGHATAIDELSKKTGCQEVIIDQFANEVVVETALRKKGLSLNLTQRTKGEEDIVVAGASILARAAFVRGIEKLSERFNLTLPKGASQQVILAGKKFIASHGRAALDQVAKLHFKTIKDF
ncbi:MAG: ribonuclease HIII [Chlamydiia bacterium]|nr:ribonuclease HIII [Chlamydiia bacterium]